MAKKVINQLRDMKTNEVKRITAMKNTLTQARQKLKSEGMEFGFTVIKESEVTVEVTKKDLERNERAVFPVTTLESLEVTRDRIQKETNRRFSVKKVVIVERKKDKV
jgi:prephenate dehydratase